MCVLCNTVSSDRGWGGVDWVDLATVRPISSSAVWNGCLATVTCKAHPNTETYISGLRGFHLAGTPTPHQVLWLMNHVSSSVVKRYCCDRGELQIQGISLHNCPQPPHWLASKDLCTSAFRCCPLPQTLNFVDVVVLFSACLIGILSWYPFLYVNMWKKVHANWWLGVEVKGWAQPVVWTSNILWAMAQQNPVLTHWSNYWPWLLVRVPAGTIVDLCMWPNTYSSQPELYPSRVLLRARWSRQKRTS